MVQDQEEKVRVLDGKPPMTSYSAEVIRRARLAWCLYGNDKQVERELGLPHPIVQTWRDKQAPDGRDWYETKAQLGIASVDQLLEIIGPQDISDHCRQMVRWGIELLSACVTVLHTHAYYTTPPDKPKRRRVRWLYDQEGNKIRMLGMRPTNFHQLVIGMREAAKIADVHLEWAERLKTLEAQRRMDIARITQLLANAIDDSLDLSEEDQICYRRALAVTGERIARATLEDKGKLPEQEDEDPMFEEGEALEHVGADPAELTDDKDDEGNSEAEEEDESEDEFEGEDA